MQTYLQIAEAKIKTTSVEEIQPLKSYYNGLEPQRSKEFLMQPIHIENQTSNYIKEKPQHYQYPRKNIQVP